MEKKLKGKRKERKEEQDGMKIKKRKRIEKVGIIKKEEGRRKEKEERRKVKNREQRREKREGEG